MTRVIMCCLILLLAGCGSSTSLVEARDHLDATYTSADAAGVWISSDAPPVVADALDINLHADDSVLQSGNHYLRGSDWLAVVGPSSDGAGSRIELDDYQTGYNRHIVFLGGFWGSRPGSYGPRSSTGGSGGGGFTGIRGGGSGGGK